MTGIDRTADVAAALANRTHGLAIRLTRAELEAGGLALAIARFLQKHGQSPEEIDLIIDLGEADELIPEGIMALTDAFLAQVPDHARWRTLTLSASAFPLSMGSVDRNSHEFVERAEWIAWRDGLFANRSSLTRLPAFSDCAIQHPRGVEGFDFRTMQTSATIRYTVGDNWLLIKGEGTRTSPPCIQFPALSTKLAYGLLRSSFASVEHCDGCRSVKSSADGGGRLGSAGVWRRVGTIHHITSVLEDLQRLPWT